MKKIIIATIIGLMASGSVFAAKEYKNQEQREDQLHGYQQPAASPSQPAETGGKYSNQDAREDQLQGYGQTKASGSEPATVRVGRANNEQQEDTVYGYKK